MLESFKEIDSTNEAEIILISDGENVRGSIERATANLIAGGVVVHSIAVTEEADERLEHISKGTGGRCFSYTEGGATSLAAIFNEIISGRSAAGSAVVTVCVCYFLCILM